jgi:hypothetical protein
MGDNVVHILSQTQVMHIGKDAHKMTLPIPSISRSIS